MADINPTQVIHGAPGMKTVEGVAGEALAVEKAVFKSSADGKWYLLDVDDTVRMALLSSGSRKIGIVIFAAAALDDPVEVVVEGPVNLGAVLTAGVAYYGSDNAGGIRPAADNGTGDVPVYLGTALTTSILDLWPHNHETAI